MALNPTELFAANLVQQFERLDRVCDDIDQRLPRSNTGDGRATNEPTIESMLESVREKLSRKRLRVGFLGTSQAGKSTTLNHYIGRGLLPRGKLRSCTSIRIRFFAKPSGSPYEVSLLFLTRAGYLDRRDDIAADLLGLYERDADSRCDDADTLKLLEQAEIDEDDQHVADLLRRLVEAAQANAHLLSEGSQRHCEAPKRIPHNDSDVADLLTSIATHDGSSDLQYALLDEIQLGVPGLEMPEKLELVDLPGLSTRRGADTAYTMRAAKELDGAIVAINVANNFDAPENYEIVRRLRNEFNGSAKRVWIVATKIDSVPRDLFSGPPGGNFLDTVGSVLKVHNLLPAHVSFISNEYFALPNNPASIVQQLVSTKGLSASERGDIQFPAAFDSHPELRGAIKRFCPDGGIQDIKNVVNGPMEKAIIADLSEQQRQRLIDVAHRQIKFVAARRRAMEIGSSGRTLARHWCHSCESVMQQIADDLRNPVSDHPLRVLASDLRSAMRAGLDKTLAHVNPSPTGTDLATRFRDASEEMFSEGANTINREGLVSKYFSNLVESFRIVGEEKPGPPGLEDPVSIVQSSLREAHKEPWRSRLERDFDSLCDDTLLDAHGTINVSLSDFRNIMLMKMEQVVRQRIYRINSFSWSQFSELLDQLRDFAPPERDVANIDLSVFDKLLEELNSIVESLNNAAPATHTGTVDPFVRDDSAPLETLRSNAIVAKHLDIQKIVDSTTADSDIGWLHVKPDSSEIDSISPVSPTGLDGVMPDADETTIDDLDDSDDDEAQQAGW